MFKNMLHVSALAALLVVCGCSSTPVTEDNTNPVLEPALNDPSGLNSSAGDQFSSLGGGAGQGHPQTHRRQQTYFPGPFLQRQ